MEPDRQERPSGGTHWTTVASFAAGFDADVAVERLEAAGIPAIARAVYLVGAVESKLSHGTSQGVDVVVPLPFIDEARTLLGGSDDADND